MNPKKTDMQHMKELFDALKIKYNIDPNYNPDFLAPLKLLILEQQHVEEESYVVFMFDNDEEFIDFTIDS